MTNINQNQKTQGNKSSIKNMKEKMNIKNKHNRLLREV